MTLEELRERRQGLVEESETIVAKAQAESRDLTVEESDRVDQLLDASERCKTDIVRLERMNSEKEDLAKPQGRKTVPASPHAPDPDDDEDETPVPSKKALSHPGRFELQPVKNAGFCNLGEMALAVADFAISRGSAYDKRLERLRPERNKKQSLASASTYGNESSGADGGFAVPPDFRNSIMETVLSEESLMSRCDQVTVDGNQFTCPVDETSPWQTTGGIQAYWDGEAAAATQSKPALKERTVKLNKIRALVPMTEESMADASALDAWLRKKAPIKIAHKVDLAIFQGTGVGQPLGILNSPSLVTVSKESSQTADTLMGINVVKMYSRMYAPSRRNAVWIINQDIEPELINLSLPGRDGVGNAVSGWGGLLYIPPGGLSAAPYGTLFGRPVIPHQVAETLGDKGDIVFADLTQYLALLKSGPNPRVDVSMHLWFDQDLTAFKFILRVGGVPWWESTLAARDGSTTYSPFVTLEAR